jgi:hypothetical protein
MSEDLPAWLTEATLLAMQAAQDRSRAAGRRQVAEAVRLAALAHCPALPASMIAEAVELVLRRPPRP